jgi:hypothetical protein
VAARSRCSAPRIGPACWRNSPTPVSTASPPRLCRKPAATRRWPAAGCRRGELPFDILCIEGALLRGPNGSGRFQMLSGSGRPLIDWVRELAAHGAHRARHRQLQRLRRHHLLWRKPHRRLRSAVRRRSAGGLLGPDFRAAAGLPVINVAGCPVHPGWVVDTLLALALGRAWRSDLDAWQRPRFYTEQLVHHGCPRNEYYEFKASAQKLSDLGCLMENLGCKGTQANADCNLRPWNGVGSCVRGGFACISCTEPGFEEPGHPFMETPKIAGIPTGCRSTCRKPGSSRSPRCPSRRRRSGCARIRAPIIR